MNLMRIHFKKLAFLLLVIGGILLILNSINLGIYFGEKREQKFTMKVQEMSKNLPIGTSVSLNSDLVLLVKDKNISKFQILGGVISMLGGLGLIISFKDNTI
ncbi:hypothetical protein [Clostridium sp. CF012]|uniref:hypothetical protein n=1 Tax=Clostridium sp. CF012 TaxID=2843319 RepID=UPI001C0BC1D0|nr:hypothetical protein [Clostridium sp. CF012]MBU3144705.1 hypothetical protein [Clostridium sp. CF012]